MTFLILQCFLLYEVIPQCGYVLSNLAKGCTRSSDILEDHIRSDQTKLEVLSQKGLTVLQNDFR